MIYIDLNGRCGDQFFQYSFARKIQIYLKNNEPLQLNFYNQNRWKNKINDNSFRNDLSRFHIVDHFAYVDERQNIYRFGSKKQIRLLKRYYLVRRVATRFSFVFLTKISQKKLQKNGIFYEDQFFSFYRYPKKNVNVFIRGYFEDYLYYEDLNLKESILKELVPIKTSADKNDLLSKINKTNSVCVSIRSWKEVAQFSEIINSRFICDKKYFDNAMDIMRQKYPDCVFYIFSDDLDFAHDVVGDRPNAVFENEGNSIEDKIVLMSSCKHFILSNSSFSWWVQYLSNRKQSTVISPTRWYTDKNDTRVINNNWFKI